MVVGYLTAVKFLARHSFLAVFSSVNPPHNKLLSGGER